VGEITSDSAPPQGIAVDEKRFDETVVGDAKVCTITEVSPPARSRSSFRPETLVEQLRLDPRAGGLLDHALFEGITAPGKLLILGSWRDRSAASGWQPVSFEGAGDIRHRQVRVIRDYGMFERREAPQFYPDVEKAARE
jgi:hypothetical protein